MSARFIVLLIGVILLLAPANAGASNFGRLFPELPPDRHSDADLTDLVQVQLDPNAVTENNCVDTTVLASTGCSFSIMTYGAGQFIDHDITRDESPNPDADVDPTTIPNARTFKLDLDSVYGTGAVADHPELYTGEPGYEKFIVQNPNVNGVRDLPRDPSGRAILGDHRNDENQIIAQFHTAILFAHNRLIDEGNTFDRARRILVRHYQSAVINELTDHTLSPEIGTNPLQDAGVVRLALRQLLRPEFTPVEFSVAAFRYGHSNVRLAYRLNGNNACQNLQVFSLTAPDADLHGGRPLQATRQIDWGMFSDELPKPAGCENNDRNIQRKFDELLSASLFRLPIGDPTTSTKSNLLGFLNVVRATHYGLPSGQSVAEALRLPVLTDAEIGLPADLTERFTGQLPLWFYILRESKVRENGLRLGPVGSTIVASSFLAMLLRDDNSVVRRPLNPRVEIAGEDRRMTFTDLVKFARTER